MASLAAMLTFLKMSGSITAIPGLGIPFITSFTVPETYGLLTYNGGGPLVGEVTCLGGVKK